MSDMLAKVAAKFRGWHAGTAAGLFLLLAMCSGGNKQEGLKKAVQADLSTHQQQWFDAFHPVGRAKSIKLHEAEAESGRIGARFTLYWEGPLKRDGFTKIQAVYDGESERWVRAEILETNGVTNTQAVNGVVGFLQGLF